MCLNDYELNCMPRDALTKRQKNLCNEQLAINREILCSILATCKSLFPKPVKCLEGLGICGIYGMLWEKYFGEEIDLTINGINDEDYNIITQNVASNSLKAKVLKEDPCILLRRNSYDFIFLNCKTNTSKYLDSVFSNMNDDAILVITTSEDSSLYWQAPEIALRNYGGTIAKTSYHRELAARLVMAEMVRACARYQKALMILCTIGYKSQQSFTIVAKVKKDTSEANRKVQKIQKLAHCNICENRKFISNSSFLDKLSNPLSCNCSAESEGKVIVGIGPLWAGEIFNVEFIESMIENLSGCPWKPKILSLLDLVLQEARCSTKPSKQPSEPKKKKYNEHNATEAEPHFYFNTHRHSPKEFKLQKLTKIVSLLQGSGYRASRTHFDSEAVRTNAPLSECIRILRQNSSRDLPSS